MRTAKPQLEMTFIFVLMLLVCLFGMGSGASGVQSPLTRVNSVRGSIGHTAMSGSLLKLVRMRSGASKSVAEIADMTHFRSILSKAGKNKLVVVDFTATWCPPCKMIAPVYQSMSEEYPKAVFTKVDVDAASDVAKEYEVMSMPTFMFFKNGKVVARFSGASADKLRQIIETYI